MVGGSETLTTTISGAIHHLLAHPPKLEKVAQERRTHFTSSAQITGSSIARLPYLNAVIDETLRLCPPIPDTLRRQDTGNEAVAIAGHAVAPGTTVSVSCYSMFRSAQHFSEPEAFEPMRFLDGTDEDKESSSALLHNDMAAFHPFSLGPRGCLGQSLARLEMRLSLAVFLYRYDICLPEGEILKDWTDQKIYWTWEKRPLKFQVSKFEE